VADVVLIADGGYAKGKALRACLDPFGANARAFIVILYTGWDQIRTGGPGTMVLGMPDAVTIRTP
jgi:hypothetical protein